jgi:hypothetical protein
MSENDFKEWGVRIPLFMHQKNSIVKMETVEKCRELRGGNIYVNTNVAILGDKTGSGKTLMMISLLARDRNKIPNRSNHDSYLKPTILLEDRKYTRKSKRVNINNTFYNRVSEVVETFFYVPINVVVVSPSILNQWKDELSKTNLKCLFIHLNKHLEEYNETYDLIVVTYKRYNEFVSFLNILYKTRFIIKRFILDEIYYLPGMKLLESDFVWVMSANMYINNDFTDVSMHHSYIKKILGSINPKEITIKNTDEDIAVSYSLPSTVTHNYKCFSRYDGINSRFISSDIRRMIAADDLSSAIYMLGGQKTSNDNLQNLIIQKEEENLRRLEAKVKYYIEMNDEKQVEKYKEKQMEASKSFEALKERISMLSKECPVCMEDIVNRVLVECCMNSFCNVCVLQLLKTTCKCPLCRTQLDPSKMIYAGEEKEEKREERKEERRLNKQEQLVEIIKNNPQGKYIVFSEFNNTFFNIIETLNKNNIKNEELKGSVERINNILRQFKSGEISVLFLNSRYNGSGINLQECSDIIIYHKMESVLEQQIIGRALRIGRRQDLHVHKLFYENE